MANEEQGCKISPPEQRFSLPIEERLRLTCQERDQAWQMYHFVAQEKQALIQNARALNEACKRKNRTIQILRTRLREKNREERQKS